jgi:hypothetical protein
MFIVEVDSLDAYFNFDPARKKDLVALDIDRHGAWRHRTAGRLFRPDALHSASGRSHQRRSAYWPLISRVLKPPI